jgi:adenylate cyclase
VFGTTKSPQESFEKAFKLMQEAIASDEGHSVAHAYLSQLYCFKRDYEKAIAEGERALALDPNGAMVHTYYGMTLIYADRTEEAIPFLKKAIRLNPVGPPFYFGSLGHAYRIMGRFEEAVSAYKTALERAPNNIHVHLGLAAVYSLMGHEKEARAEAAEVLRMNPKFSVDSWAKNLPYKDQSQGDKVVNALRKAGLK